MAIVSGSSEILIRDKSEGSDFDIFFVPSRRTHDARRRPGDDRLGQRKENAVGKTCRDDLLLEVVVELLRDVARKLEMLLLVFPDRHMRRAVSEDVRSHQVRIRIKPDGRLLAILARLFLELRHAVEPAEPCNAIADPGEFRVRAHL